MTAFRLKKKESARKGITRVAHERIEDASELLRDEDADPVEAIHEARKDMKKLRSTLKLVRPVIGEDVYRRENDRFRDAARALSDVRDAQVRAETVEALVERFPDDPPPGGWWTVRGILSDPGDGARELGSLRDRAATAIEAGDSEVDDWPLGEKGFDLLRPGLKRAYSRGRKRYSEAREDRTDERLHEFRKRSKDLWYQLRLVRRGWPEVLETTADEAHELSDALGDDHDLVVLAADLDDGFEALTAEQREHLRRLIETRRGELQDQAFAYAERIFAEKPKRFVARIEDYWRAPAL
jgi:CHAD domain-containing protein